MTFVVRSHSTAAPLLRATVFALCKLVQMWALCPALRASAIEDGLLGDA